MKIPVSKIFGSMWAVPAAQPALTAPGAALSTHAFSSDSDHYISAPTGGSWGHVRRGGPDMGRSPFRSFPDEGKAVREELDFMKGLSTKGQSQAYLRRVGGEIVQGIKEVHGSEELGFHYNLHGGAASSYIEAGGIRATMGDVALRFGMDRKPRFEVYFYRSSHMNLYDILNQSNPEKLFWPSRMGDLITIFRLDADYFRWAFKNGIAVGSSEWSITFDAGWLDREKGWNRVGIPLSTFVAPPIDPFKSMKRRAGLAGPRAWFRRLSRDEETLVAMRVIERVAGPPSVLYPIR